ncbi:unnamed protein product, partial [Musa hybrid cultivar]
GESAEKRTGKAVLDLGRSPRYAYFAFARSNALSPSCLPEEYALPGRHGISDPGDEGIRFLDWLGSACTSVWQEEAQGRWNTLLRPGCILGFSYTSIPLSESMLYLRHKWIFSLMV